MTTIEAKDLPPEDRFYAVRSRVRPLGAMQKRHKTLESALKKAQNVANATGKNVFVLEVIGAVVPKL